MEEKVAAAQLSRRAVLVGGTLLATGGAAGMTPAAAGPAVGQGIRAALTPLPRAGWEAWAAQVGSIFTVRGEDGPVALRLVAVRPIDAAGPRPASLPRDRAFAAVFEGARGALPAGNRTYPASHPAQGTMSLHFGTGGRQLVAIFN